MKKLFVTLLKKELFTILHSYSFWVSFLFFHFVMSVLFLVIPVWFDLGFSSFSYFFSLYPFVFIVVIPMLTMGAWTDEYKSQTSKLLFLFPVSESVIVLTKFFACGIMFFVQLLTSLLIPLSVAGLTYFEGASFLFSFFSSFAFALSCIAISLSASSVSEESAIAFVFSFLTIAFFSLVHFILRFVNLPKVVESFIKTISFNQHFQNASLGIFDLSDYIFYFALTLFGIALNVFILKYKRIKK